MATGFRSPQCSRPSVGGARDKLMQQCDDAVAVAPHGDVGSGEGRIDVSPLRGTARRDTRVGLVPVRRAALRLGAGGIPSSPGRDGLDPVRQRPLHRVVLSRDLQPWLRPTGTARRGSPVAVRSTHQIGGRQNRRPRGGLGRGRGARHVRAVDPAAHQQFLRYGHPPGRQSLRHRLLHRRPSTRPPRRRPPGGPRDRSRQGRGGAVAVAGGIRDRLRRPGAGPRGRRPHPGPLGPGPGGRGHAGPGADEDRGRPWFGNDQGAGRAAGHTGRAFGGGRRRRAGLRPAHRPEGRPARARRL